MMVVTQLETGPRQATPSPLGISLVRSVYDE